MKTNIEVQLGFDLDVEPKREELAPVTFVPFRGEDTKRTDYSDRFTLLPEDGRRTVGRAALRARAAVLFTRLQDMGLQNVESLVLMRTRTVMLSLIGRTLRVNEGYVDAPDSVLRAIVAFSLARTRAARATARDTILGYEVDRPAKARRLEKMRAGDPAMIAQLKLVHGQLNVKHFDGKLTDIVIRVSGKMATRLGHFDPGTRRTPSEIVISRRHISRHGWKEAIHTLLHEMVHQWQHESGIVVDHGAEFRRKAREVGITAAAKRELPSAALGRRTGYGNDAAGGFLESLAG